ncbi:hypothetical protein Cs7R123_45520 [Catellatospora sp. TT07R-123]|uniref:hypothetical protein n=1 Tax=Catellatospora sp. TT07R-123 TaxID=2733863 RepID=UPI001B20B59F|nr:hypothetical protein [Catellatospora sp. TT07R-123]GHJ47210.1 hypothetical protein Cs7R123_45520 [Catellatospora sp. TT07R-123]
MAEPDHPPAAEAARPNADRRTPGPAPAAVPDPAAMRAARLAVVMGLAHAVLFTAAFLILHRVPSAGDPDQTVLEYYLDPGTRRQVLLAGIYLMPLAAITFLWFITTLRMWIAHQGRPEHVLFSNLQLGAGLSYIVLELVAAAAFSVGAAVAQFGDGVADPATMRGFAQLGRLVSVILAMRMAAMFVLTTASLGRHTRIMPRWFLVLSVAVGLTLFLAATLDTWLLLLFPAWLLMLCAILLVRLRRAAGTAVPSG